MAKVENLGEQGGQAIWAFQCPGCCEPHGFEVPRWSFNGDVDSPTFSPSLNVRPGGPLRCHSFVRDGRIQFLGDCQHELAGQTVELPELE